MTSARNAGFGPKPGQPAGERKAIETGDPDFPILYEATEEEMKTLRDCGFTVQ